MPRKKEADNQVTKVAKRSKAVNKVISEQEAALFEEIHVHNIYKHVAKDFSVTRIIPEPCIKKFLEQLPAGSLVLDAGCGNGKNMCSEHLTFCGLDYCQQLAEIALNHAAAIIGDIQALPYKDQVFDAIFSDSVIHHFSTEKRRQQAVKELFRVLKPGGMLLLRVWAFEQGLENQDQYVPWGPIPQQKSKQQEKEQKTQKEEERRRFYHFFKKGEVVKLGCNTGFRVNEQLGHYVIASVYGKTEMSQDYFDNYNWLCVFNKP